MYINIENAKMISYSYEKYEMYLPYFTSSMTMFIQILVFGLLMFAVFVLLSILMLFWLDIELWSLSLLIVLYVGSISVLLSILMLFWLDIELWSLSLL